MMTCEEVRLALGAHALGALDPDEALEIDTHMATCEACGAELVELEGVAAFLGKVSERDVELVASPPRQVLDRLLNDRAKRSRRGRLLLAVAASVAVLGLGGTIWTVVQETTAHETSSAAAPASAASPEQEAAPDAAAQDQSAGTELRKEPSASEAPQPLASPLPEPSASSTPKKAVAMREFTGENGAKEFYATVMAWPGDAGTDLGVQVIGVPVGTNCRLVVVAEDGRREVTDSWVISREVYQDKAGKAMFKSTTTLAVKDIARFDVVDQNGKLLVRVPAQSQK